MRPMICEALDFTLTQPIATLITGGFALVAASIAYCGVLKSVSEQRKADRRKRRVDQLLDATSAMYTAANRIMANDYANGTERLKLTHDAQAAFAKLEILGYEDAADRARKVLDVIKQAEKDGTTNTPQFSEQLGASAYEAVETFKAAVQQTEGLD